ncbi:hypothetical protein FJM67_08175 [Maribrevibacterium harenarium]|uniref:PLD phosphodiesterase domain-containing protein n=1 Tax=Maribrevibacterium harenarium TaxID=2589817 RepID=A0A501WUD9_9GAMM|nr:hypothetical protein [Maribrevibacterium harenarium]TPE51945.1 hypothetical protein FJM67_08175 [Maribrevibacterium harenarium]
MDKAQSLFQQVSLQFQALGQVEALVLTTFGLDIEYLEKSILPSFFPSLGEGPSSEPHRPLFEYLEENPTPISVLFDANNLVRGEMSLSASTAVLKELRWQSFPVIRSGYCFHPKVILALTRQNDIQTLVIGCGSANLTKPGWGRNFEACVIDTIPLKQGMRSLLLKDVYDMITALRKDAKGSDALDRIKAAVDGIGMERYKNIVKGSHSRLWLGSKHHLKSEQTNLVDWVQTNVISRNDLQDSGAKWQLDVLSPYFGEKPPELLHWVSDCFSTNGSAKVRPSVLVYCPRDGDLLDITSSTFSSYSALPNVNWGEFKQNPLVSEFRDHDGNRLQRFLHAKVYRFWSPIREIIIVGSANATPQGHRDTLQGNDEACMVIRRQIPEGAPKLTSWLRPLNKEVGADSCKDVIIQEDTPPHITPPIITLEFDWENFEFNALSKDSRVLKLFFNSEVKPFLTLDAKEKVCRLTLKKAQVDALFRSASIKITTPVHDDQAWLILVTETNLHLKPPAPSMERSIDDLLRDWQLGPEQRQAAQISRAAMPMEHGILGDQSSQETEDLVATDRLNDLFLAMYRFRSDIIKNIEAARQDSNSFAKLQLKTRLFGRGAMSVRYFLGKLSSSLEGDEGGVDVVERYLGVMSLKDSLNRLHPKLKGLRVETEFRSLASSVEQEYRKIRRELKKELIHEKDSPSPERLIRWLEHNFDYDQRLPMGAQR